VTPRLAIIADWLTTFAGAEHTILEFHRLWPAAPLFTSVANRARLGPLATADIRTTYLQTAYQLLGKHQLLLPFLPRAIESIDVRGYDVILSSSHAVGKGIIPPSTARHVCYCHTPMRYAWEMEAEYLRDFHVPKWLQKRVRRELQRLRVWDLSTAQRVDTFIANSTETQKRIAATYGRDSMVIPPPVDERFLQYPLPSMTERHGFLALGRLVPYKRFDLLIEAANHLQLPLTIAGTGQEAARLKAMAGPTVTFLGYVPDADVPKLYACSQAVLFPAFEDAGIVPLEAQACGTPVIAYGRGGACDSVKDGVTGLLFAEQTVESLVGALQTFAARTFDALHIRAHAEQFAAPKFRQRIQHVIDAELAILNASRPLSAVAAGR
jgi:glycosyltransferase involved in cell wall biosynthesis